LPLIETSPIAKEVSQVKIPSTLASVGKSPDSGRAKSVGQRPAPAAAAPTDQVELSTLSARLQEAGAALDDTPVADAAHVAQIKQAIADGKFQIVPERIANGLLRSVRDLLASGK
jgi:negative regulator of flagellin synthesis FlgM